MKTTFGSFAIENNLKELEKTLLASGFDIEDKELKAKFDEAEKLMAVRESLTEAYEVGCLNVKYLSGESVNSSDYVNAILKIERGDHEKLIKHYNYNVVKLHKAKNDLVGIIDDISIPNASMESYQSSLYGYNVSVEGIGDVFNKIGEKIKKAWEYIIEKMKKFFNWITGKSGEADSASQAASTTNVTETVKGQSGESVDKKKNEESKNTDNGNEKKVVDAGEFEANKTKAFNTAFDALSKMNEELSENDLVAIVKPFIEINIGSKLLNNLKNKCKSTKKGVVTNGSSTKETDISYVSKQKVFNYLQDLQNKMNDNRSMVQKGTDMLKSGVKTAGKAVASFFMFPNFGKKDVKSSGSSGGEDGGSEGSTPQPKDDSVSSFGYKYHKIDGVNDVDDQKDIIDSCKNFMINKTSAKTFLAMEIIGSGTSPSPVGEADIKNLTDIFTELSKAVNGYADGFKNSIDRAIKTNINVANASKPATPNTANSSNNSNDKKQIQENAKKNLDLDVTVDEETHKTVSGLIGKMLDRQHTLDDYIRKLINSRNYVVVDSNNKIDSNGAAQNRIFKGFGSQLDKVIVVEFPMEKTSDKMTLEDIKPYEIILNIRKESEENVHRTLYSLPAERLVEVTNNLKANVDKLKNSIKVAQTNFDKTLDNMKKLKEYAEGKGTNGITLSKKSINQVSKFLMGGIRLTSITATAIATRRNNLAKELEVIMAYGNHLSNSIQDAIAYQNKDGVKAAFGDIDAALNAASADNAEKNQ